MSGFSVIEFDAGGMPHDVSAEYVLRDEQEWCDAYYDADEYKQYQMEWE